MSAGGSMFELGSNGLEDSGIATEGQLIAEKHRLESMLAKQNIELKSKDEKILELLESIEDYKIQLYAREKSVELAQDEIEKLLEDLREAKAFEHKCKML